MLRLCGCDWSLEYTALDHPLHGLVAGYAAEVMGRAVTPVGIDGCGVPTLRSDVVGLARAFAHVAIDPDFAHVRRAAMRYASLTRDGDRPETVIARVVPGGRQGRGNGVHRHRLARRRHGIRRKVLDR